MKSFDNCAQYINCTSKNSKLGNYRHECAYPDLFSDVTFNCEKFQSVVCKNRTEPQAPCQYEQNLCSLGDMSCKPCSERLPSCVGRNDGAQSFFGREWTSSYVICLQNRTIDIHHCTQTAIFNPQIHQCVNGIDQRNIDSFCKANPQAIKPHPTDCAQYVNCSHFGTQYGKHIQECTYPDLFSSTSLTCQQFESVTCAPKNEPQAPCDYLQNACAVGDANCQPCPKRLPSCIGLPNGPNPHPYHLWGFSFITCFKNRTLYVDRCADGKFFHPREKSCQQAVKTVDVPDYCFVHPGAVLPDLDNCAYFFNCSYPESHKECKYPDLFSRKSLSCQDFTTVNCEERIEPQEPCEYKQNLCPVSSPSCEFCPLRLPSCVGKSDGNQSFIGHLWEPLYITCYKNRTIKIAKCPHGYFHPFNNVCQSKIGHDGAPSYCKTHPFAVVAKEDNCAQYYNCSLPAKRFASNQIQECTYPNLFSRTTLKCETFTSVSCDSRLEPQAPCEYNQNKCGPLDPSCQPCSERLPSCVGITDGFQPVSGYIWTDRYMECQMNRTISIYHCSPGWVFNPFTGACVQYVMQSYVLDYCQHHPTDIMPDPINCAMYVNCSTGRTRFGDYKLECSYPQLFDVSSGKCKNFDTVNCQGRRIPVEPCDYEQNICLVGDNSCKPCPERFPSCSGLIDGFNPDPRSLWTGHYIRCFHNRTVAVETCPNGYFNVRTRQCSEFVNPVDVKDYCKYHKDDILPNPDNCAMYFHCKRWANPLQECQYPSLFSQITNKCEPFPAVFCGSRPEPVAP
ncbi:uncharacterized protein LOC134240032, partial [Saccostrea cucullata]|uniref:uncharacterized protein LOC134240032 n=1 Tax=Saccostrea cuccullata TaxID=36930 RepID=UPI002ED4877B